MDRAEFLEQVRRLRDSGKSIRAIASDLGVHRSRVERGLNSLARGLREDSTSVLNLGLQFVTRAEALVGRQSEMDELKAALEEAYWGRGRLVMLVGEPGKK